MVDLNKSFIGVGKVYVRAAGSTAKHRFVGNVSVATLAHELDVKKQKDYTRLGGGTAVQVERLEAVTAAFTLFAFSPENLALATAGTLVEVTGAPITDEVVKGYVGTLVRLAHPPLAVTSVKDEATGLITYEAGDDYVMSPAGLTIPEGSSIVDAADLEVSYTHATYQRIEAATKTSTILEVLVEGLNEADSGKPVIVDMWRVSFPSADELAIIGDELGELAFSTELLSDATKGSGVSAFYRVLKT